MSFVFQKQGVPGVTEWTAFLADDISDWMWQESHKHRLREDYESVPVRNREELSFQSGTMMQNWQGVLWESFFETVYKAEYVPQW